MSKIRVIIADDMQILRKGLKAILSQDEEKIDFLAKCAEAAQEFKVES